MLQESAAEGYYADKLGVLRRTFAGKSVTLGKNSLIVEEQTYPIVDDVIILLPKMQWPSRLQGSGMSSDRDNTKRGSFSEEIQHTFGVQWNKFSVLMEEHEKEFEEYFDLTGTEGFKDQVLCDLGCGMGRWSYFLAPHCRNIILVDFSDAIFAARHTLRDAPNALFFMADINALPFAAEFTDFLFCLGVLH
ncbi:MAG: class I SAM-dependent methyltransferase, partial [Stellaceae bacterium]